MLRIKNFIKRLKPGSLALLFLLTQASFALTPFINTQSAVAVNGGTLKVHELGTPSDTESNDPKVCAFNFEGFGFDVGQEGLIKIEPQGGDTGTTDSLELVFGPADADGYYATEYINDGGLSLDDGHYKSTLYGKDINGEYTIDLKAKSKVFKVECDLPELGGIKVNKAIDKDGDGVYEITDNDAANELGFRWGLNTDLTDNTMGSTEDALVAGQKYTVKENSLSASGYSFEGWYFSTSDINNCENPKGFDWPEVKVIANQTRHVTLCNQKQQIRVDYCDPSQRPSGMSIKQWLNSGQFNGADCFDYSVVQECGMLNIQVTKQPTMDGWADYEAVYTTDGSVVTPESAKTFPANFNEDENSGSVDVSWYLIGPESDYLTGTTLPNFWDETSTKVTVKTDCEEKEKEKIVICHATNSLRKPYRRIEVSTKAVDGRGKNDHSHHDGPVFDPSVHDQQNRGWGDIFPPVDGVTGGLNWLAGEEIYNKDCETPKDETNTLTIHKIAKPQSDTDFMFTIQEVMKKRSQTPSIFDQINVQNEANGFFDEFTLDDAAQDDGDAWNDQTSYEVNKGTVYKIKELKTEGWNLKDAWCEGARSYSLNENTRTLTVRMPRVNADVHCYFKNKKKPAKPSINVTKFHDINQNGVMDEGEDTLAGWDMQLTAQNECNVEYNRLLFSLQKNIDCNKDDYNDVKSTNDEGVAAFTDLDPKKTYILEEVLQDGWNWSSTYCDYGDQHSVGEAYGDNKYLITPYRGDTVNCYVGNYQEPVLNLEKSNDNPFADNGEIVTYTLNVSLPENSGALFHVCVNDLPPEGFDYNGVWTASSSNAAHNAIIESEVNASGTDCGSPGGPDYSSPGQWYIGDLMPGEVVTLTYQTIISDAVFPGTYPDIAYVNGCALPTEECPEDEVVYSNIHRSDDPFVGTAVTIPAPQVLGASTTRTILVEAGTSLGHVYGLLAGMLIAGALFITRRQPTTEGVQR